MIVINIANLNGFETDLSMREITDLSNGKFDNGNQRGKIEFFHQDMSNFTKSQPILPRFFRFHQESTYFTE